ncbi:MAG TPA: hypothetical protein VGA92_06720 [Candidatus Nitrosotenuis sp.]
MSKTQQKTRKSDKLYPKEEAVVKRILSGKEKLYKFDNPEDALGFLRSISKKEN